ncbi:T9SS type B sorting domain-containing protein [Fulvivirga lutea]|uniref:Gliding motility-associated C-terminal domain-containing protein n=1 Tax=Fulvivirga lutea TaxID=2810512 RepID=A0A974WF52_9BACT|nr:gliding motility-associated C-terminal domain-containing protein [Fulvivirga lutea]QSE97319.1 gliding motility-associated C-terminal domain-containing protein [Fulvivirga lutea]
MRKLLLLFFLLVGKLTVFASHIVGGEFELLHVEDFDYQLNMVLYFDELNGTPGARQNSITAYIYRKSDNAQMRSILLNVTEDVFVPYSNVECDDGQLVTSRIFYTAPLTLSAEEYDDPEGYYVAWERCCRNYTITNIFSDNPAGAGTSAGQTFYLEFPPVVRDGQQFINSTPRLFPPLRDYGCVDNFYFADFGGIDDDGDSLVYSLVTPYSTVDTQNALPVTPNPGPYPEVIWKPGFSLENIVGGDPDLAISDKGLLTLTPRSTGLYVFAVECKEFRDGEQIGVMRRDFQMLVVSNCINEPPVVRAREKGASGFYSEGTQLFFPFGAAERCIEILVNDIPVSGDVSEDVNIQPIPINFDADLEGITIDVSQNVSIVNELDTARFEICFPECPYVRNKPYQIGIIALDDACPQPALDTVIVTLNIEPPPNTTAYYAESRNGTRINSYNRTVISQANGSLTFDINGYDAEDPVTFEITPLGFDLEEVGMSFTEPVFGDREVTTTFSWNYDCNANNINLSAGRDVEVPTGIRKAFDILLSLDDEDQCLYEDPRNTIMTLNIDFPDQTKPRVFESQRPADSYLKLNYNYGQTVDLDIRGRDNDNDQINLFGRGANFNFGDVGASFENKEGSGNPGLTSKFLWEIPCQYEAELDSFRLEFFVEDLDDCQLTNIDTLEIDILLSPPTNAPPDIFINSLNSVPIIGDSIGVIVNTEIELNIRALDAEGDTILLDLFERSSTDPFEFAAAREKGTAQSVFRWTPDCTDLTGANLTRTIDLTFIARDLNCYNPQGISKDFTIHVIDQNAGETDILPPNLFTPNGDGLNEYFGMYNMNEATNELENILPIDNCAGQFEEVVIFNRWGRKVFSSTDRDFKWTGDGVPSGVYFYQINYTNREYRGSVSVMY